MADQDDISPWARDDWSSADAPGFESLTAPVDPDLAADIDPAPRLTAATGRPTDDQLSPARPHGVQIWIAAAFGAVLLIGGVVALVRNDTPDRQATATAGTVPEPAAVASSDPTPGSVGAPTTTTAAGAVPAFWNAEPVETTDPASDEELAMVTSEVGEVPVWNRWSIDVPAPLDATSVATEVVALGYEGILHRIEFPSGQVRAMQMSGWGANARAAVGADSIVVFTSTDLTIIRDDQPIVRVPVRNGVIFTEAWPGTDRFIVTTPSPGLAGGEEELILEPDGALVPVESDPTAGTVFWARNFLPDGRFVVNRPGGVYAVGADQVAVRLSGGYLLAAGSAHYAVEECDETLRCATFVVDAATGERTEAKLEALGDGFGFVDPSTRISPDGRTTVFADRTRATGIRQLIDTATGSVVDVGAVNEVVYPDSWAADSSGIFSEETGSILFHPRDTGGRVVIEGLDNIASVATRRVPSGE